MVARRSLSFELHTTADTNPSAVTAPKARLNAKFWVRKDPLRGEHADDQRGMMRKSRQSVSSVRGYIASTLARALTKSKLTTRKTAALTGIGQGNLIRFARGEHSLVSLELALLAFTRLGYDCMVTIKKSEKPRGTMTLVIKDKITPPADIRPKRADAP